MNQIRKPTWIELRSEAVLIEQPKLTPQAAWRKGFEEGKRMSAELIEELNPLSTLPILVKAIGTAKPGHEEL